MGGGGEGRRLVQNIMIGKRYFSQFIATLRRELLLRRFSILIWVMWIKNQKGGIWQSRGIRDDKPWDKVKQLSEGSGITQAVPFKKIAVGTGIKIGHTTTINLG